MKIIALTTAAFLLTGGAAMAAEEGPSGRPGAVLSESQCSEVWDQTESKRDGDTLSEDAAQNFVLNFARVDSDGDSKISNEEFKEGCSKGWIQALGDVEPIEGDTDSEAPVNPGAPDADIN